MEDNGRKAKSSGTDGNCREVVPNYAKIARPILEIFGKHHFKLFQEQRQRFEFLNEALFLAPGLAAPTLRVRFTVTTDASKFCCCCHTATEHFSYRLFASKDCLRQKENVLFEVNNFSHF